MDMRLSIIFRKHINTRGLSARGRRRRKDCRISETGIGRRGRARQRDARDLNSVLRVGSTEHDGRRPSVEYSIAATYDRLLVDRIAETQTRCEVIAVAHRSDGAETG